MAPPGFAELVGSVAEGMGQRPDSVRSTPDGLFLHTSDGFLFVFLEDPDLVSLATIQRLLAEPAGRAGRLVLLTPGRLPLALSEAAVQGRATLVEHDRFRELLRGLDLGALLGEEPRGPHDVPGARLLPSARHLDAVVARARTWLDWGVPALALRFYRQALAQKPGFGPARVGVGRSLAALGLGEEALAAFEEVLRDHPGDVEARLGIAAVHAQAGRISEEIALFREVLSDRPDRDDVRAQLIAAEIDRGEWKAAARELADMLGRTPEDARLRYLHGVVLERTGDPEGGARERRTAKELGLGWEEERRLAAHLGLPEPPPEKVEAGRAPAPPPEPEPRRRRGGPATPRRPSRRPRATRGRKRK